MQALNHVAAGSIIGLTFSDPFLALPVSLLSHFALDMVPHYGNDEKAPRGSRPYLIRILADAILSFGLVAILVSIAPLHAGLIITCAILAILPDILWPLAYIAHRNKRLWSFFVFHKRIQHENRSWWRVELAWFMASILALTFIVHAQQQV